MTPDDDAALRMLAGANFGPNANLVLPSGRRLGADEAQALTGVYAPSTDQRGRQNPMQSHADRTGFDRLAAHGAQRPASAADIARDAVRADRKRRALRRWKWIVLLSGFWLTAWLLMLAVGVARANWLPDLPTVDYSTTVLLLILVGSAITILVGSRQIADILSGR